MLFADHAASATVATERRWHTHTLLYPWAKKDADALGERASGASQSALTPAGRPELGVV